MSADMVKVYDRRTKTYSMMPVSELAHGFVKATSKETGETYWVDGRDIPLAKNKKHALTDDQRARAEAVLMLLPAAVMPPPPHGRRDFLDSIAHEGDPDRELRVWGMIAGAYSRWTKGRQIGLPKRRAIARCLCVFSMTGRDGLLNPTALFSDPDMPPEDVKALARFLFAETMEQERTTNEPGPDDEGEEWKRGIDPANDST